MLVDTHAHLSFPKLAKERDDVIARAMDASVTTIVDVGTDAQTSQSAVETAARFEGVYASAGYHPHVSDSADEFGLAIVESCLREPGVVAQERLLRTHIAMALSFQLPLILHSRGAEDRVIEILEETGAGDVGGVLHCFGGSSAQASQAVAAGFYVGFGGNLTFKNSDILEVAKSVPRDRLLLETDCPYLAPVPHRGQRNEPAYVRIIAEFLASASATSVEEVAKQTTDNVRRLFGLEA